MKPELDTQKLVEDIADKACTSLFQAYGVDLETAAPDSMKAPVHLSGIVGFSGRGIRGTCILAASETPIKRSDPIGLSPRDWIAELSNQLVGRIKNQLLAHGVEVYVTTPVVLRGEHLAPMPRYALPPRAFTAEGGNVFVWIELETAPELVVAPIAQTVAASEGEALLF